MVMLMLTNQTYSLEKGFKIFKILYIICHRSTEFIEYRAYFPIVTDSIIASSIFQRCRITQLYLEMQGFEPKLSQYCHICREPYSNKAKDMLGQYRIVKLFPWHNFLTFLKEREHCMTSIANPGGFHGKVLLKAKYYIWRIF